jgi:hypothetical protein
MAFIALSEKNVSRSSDRPASPAIQFRIDTAGVKVGIVRLVMRFSLNPSALR